GGGNGLAKRQGVSPAAAASPVLIIWSWLSSAYILQATISWFSLPKHLAAWARSLAFARAGNSIAARIAIIAITTSNSISVKPDRRHVSGETEALLFITSRLLRLSVHHEGSLTRRLLL